MVVKVVVTVEVVVVKVAVVEVDVVVVVVEVVVVVVVKVVVVVVVEVVVVEVVVVVALMFSHRDGFPFGLVTKSFNAAPVNLNASSHAVAFINTLFSLFTPTAVQFHLVMSLLNDAAPRNVSFMLVTSLVSHTSSAWLNTVAP